MLILRNFSNGANYARSIWEDIFTFSITLLISCFPLSTNRSNLVANKGSHPIDLIPTILFASATENEAPYRQSSIWLDFRDKYE
jgi:hypothetical protein